MDEEDKKKILLIDDDAPIFAGINAVFRDKYQVHYAPDGEQGCAMAARLNPDLIILDSRMPGLSGKDTLLALRTRDDEVPVIFLTAFPEDVIAQVGNRGHVSSFMAKPFSVNELRKVVDGLIDNPKE